MKRWRISKEHVDAQTIADNDIPAVPLEVVNRFLTGLSQFKQVPFTNLIPNKDMLPIESIRFFQIDPNWMRSLYEGACSLGGAAHVSLPDFTPGTGKGVPVAGFIMSSLLLEVWPTTRFEAFVGAKENRTAIEAISTTKLTQGTLMFLYDQVPTQLVISQPSEGLTLGFENQGTAQDPSFYQNLRYFAENSKGQVGGYIPATESAAHTIHADDTANSHLNVAVPLRNTSYGESAIHSMDMAAFANDVNTAVCGRGIGTVSLENLPFQLFYEASQLTIEISS